MHTPLKFHDMERNFVFPNYTIIVDPLQWPEGSLPRESWMGDKEETNHIIKRKFKIRTLELIEAVVKRDVEFDKICPESVDWEDFKLAMDYLNIKYGIDYIYPLFLHRRHGKIQHEEKIMEICREEVKTERHRLEKINLFKRYGYHGIYKVSNHKQNMYYKHTRAMEVIRMLKDIPGLFITGGFSVSLFFHYDRDKRTWNDVDIFAYGPNSLENIKEGVRRCLEICDNKSGCYRTKCTINIPLHGFTVQFILFKLDSISDLLKTTDVDCSSLTFEISDPNTFYGFHRTYMSLISGINTVNPKYYRGKYVNRLLKYSKRGFRIAIPGYHRDYELFHMNTVKLEKQNDLSLRDRLKKQEFRGLKELIVYSKFPKYSRDTWSNEKNDIEHYDDHSHPCPDLFGSVKENDDLMNISPIVIGDIFNETPGTFKWYDGKTYHPIHPKIKLVDITSFERIETSFYEQYYL